MSLVTVKNKYQVVIPVQVRKQIGLMVGDLLEARAEQGRITLIPKSVVDRRIDESLDDIREGRVYGPFATAEEMAASLKANTKKVSRRKSKRQPL